MSPSSDIRYRITPTILGKFRQFLDADIEAEAFWNKDSDENYKLSPDELAAKLEGELLDTINKVPQEPSEAADMGTCLNEIVDRLIMHRKEGNPDIELRSFPTEDVPYVLAKYHGFQFMFNLNLCMHIANEFNGSVCQYYVSAPLQTKYGVVELYGYLDYLNRDKVIDLKTTSRYEFGKYEQGYQKEVYPYCLLESGEVQEVLDFTYYAVVWKKRVGAPLTGDIYPEVYTYNHDKATERLRNDSEMFIEWLEAHKDKITNRKIFNED